MVFTFARDDEAEVSRFFSAALRTSPRGKVAVGADVRED